MSIVRVLPVLACVLPALLLACSDPTLLSRSDAGPCPGTRQPQPETCNLIDDDCDGLVDNLPDCTSACGSARQVCAAPGVAICTAPQPVLEVLCNGVDDDCDGAVDELPTGSAAFCYDGPPETAGVGPCHPGVLRCPDVQPDVPANPICWGQVLPSPDVCGDGIDNDCNGVIDDLTDPGDPTPIDVAFIVDRSCSMSGYVPIVTQGLLQFLVAAPAKTKVWVFDMPGTWGRSPVSPLKGCPEVAPYRDCPEAALGVLLPDMAADQGDRELSFPAIEHVAQTVKWSPGSLHYILLFGDEEGQPAGWQWKTVNSLRTTDVRVYVWTAPSYWGDYASITGPMGALFDLNDLNDSPLVEQLESLRPSCGR